MSVLPILDEKKAGFSPKEAGAYFGVSPGLVRKAIRNGDLRAVRLGRRIIIPRASLEKFLHGSK
jgi:excisionase family DNA binding protein